MSIYHTAAAQTILPATAACASAYQIHLSNHQEDVVDRTPADSPRPAGSLPGYR